MIIRAKKCFEQLCALCVEPIFRENLKTYKPKLKVSIPPKPEAAQRVLSSELWVRSCESAQLLTFNF